MSEFEFIITGIAIVLAMAFAKLIDGGYHSIANGKFSWVATTWFANRLLAVALQFWVYKAELTRAQMTNLRFYEFLVLLTPLVLLYSQALALAGPSPSMISDWKQHFSLARRRFYAVGVTLSGAFALNVIVFETPGTSPAAFAVPAVLFATGLFVQNERWHAGIAVLHTSVAVAAFAVPIAETI